MRLIFECITSGKPKSKDDFRAAIVICKAWRRIAIGSLRLWKDVLLRMDTSPRSLREYSEIISSRAGSTRVGIWIRDMRGYIPTATLIQAFENIAINHFSAVESIIIELSHPTQIGAVLLPAFRYSGAPIPLLDIQCMPFIGQPPAWDLSTLLKQIPPVTRLDLTLAAGVLFPGDHYPSSLHVITFSHVKFPSLFTHLPRLTELAVLNINSMNTVDPTGNATLPKLYALIIRNVPQFPWENITAPKLTHLSSVDKTEDLLAFCLRHQSIRTLLLSKLPISDTQFTDLATALVSIQTLAIRVSPVQLATLIDQNLPFPELTKLHTFVTDCTELSEANLSSFVKSRCYPVPAQAPQTTKRLMK